MHRRASLRLLFGQRRFLLLLAQLLYGYARLLLLYTGVHKERKAAKSIRSLHRFEVGGCKGRTYTRHMPILHASVADLRFTFFRTIHDGESTSLVTSYGLCGQARHSCSRLAGSVDVRTSKTCVRRCRSCSNGARQGGDSEEVAALESTLLPLKPAR